MYPYKEFKVRFNKLLEFHNVTRYQVSQETGITQPTLLNYKNGRVNPSKPNVKRLAKYFNVDPDWLKNGTPEKEPSFSVEDEKVEYRKLKKLGEEHPDLIPVVTEFIKVLHERNQMIEKAIILFEKFLKGKE